MKRTLFGAPVLALLAACSAPVVLPDAEPDASAPDAAADARPIDDIAVIEDGSNPLPDAEPMDAASLPDAEPDASLPDVVSPPADGSCAIVPAPPMQPISGALLPERRVTCGCRTSAPSVTAGTMANRYVLRGRIVSPSVVTPNGEVLVNGNLIVCVGAMGACSSRPDAAGATIINTGGIIYPGLIDGHNHVAYNWLPEWTAPMLYSNRYQWQRAAAYSTYITPYRDNVGAHECAMTKYGEARAIFAGTTTIQGAPNRTCIRTLARNPEYGADFGGVDRHQTNILGIGTVDAAAAMTLRANMDSGALTTYIIHLAEGVDQSSRDEFTDLVGKNLLTRATVMVHGTALIDMQHMQAGAAGAKIVWSPRSNVLLYGDTTDIRTALMRNVLVSIGPDWTPSGAPDILQELRFARNVGRNRWPGLLTDRKLVEMVTIDGARVLDRQSNIGSIEPNKYADLMVIPDYGCDAYSSLVDALASDIAFVMVGGKPLYGDPAIMRALPAAAQAGCENTTVCGSTRVACVSVPGGANGTDQTLASITTELQSFYPMVLPLVPRCP
ncbi:MAG: amidohydrolase family protein [Polyangiales bacterium]